jgi:hypothetical protein
MCTMQPDPQWQEVDGRRNSDCSGAVGLYLARNRAIGPAMTG